MNSTNEINETSLKEISKSRHDILLAMLEKEWITLTKTLFHGIDDEDKQYDVANIRDEISDWVIDINGELTPKMQDFKIKNNICW